MTTVKLKNAMKNLQYMLLGCFLLGLLSCEKNKFDDYQENVNTSFAFPKMFSAQTNYIADMYLVYQGAYDPMEYNEEQFIPYVYKKDANGNVDWLFDGFLFLELVMPHNRQPGNNATKEDWKWLINRHFDEKVGITALNSLLRRLRTEGHVPLRKRKVVICIPGPKSIPVEWGEIDGITMDMTQDGDRLKTVEWFIDEVMKKWKESNLDEVEFSGFYWLHEGESTNLTDRAILPTVSQYVKNKGLHFYWIPYFGAAMGAEWKEMGFDIAYQQPNYFFQDPSIKSPSRMNDAIQFASKYNMGMEFECNRKLFHDTVYHRRFHEYLDYFENSYVFKDAPVGYYDDRGALYDMYKSADEVYRSSYNRLRDIIIDRQKRSDEIFKKIRR